MNITKVLVSYGDEENRKKLESYIEEKTGRKIDLGPVGYNGEATLQTMDVFFERISRTNITCAAYYPGKHFENVDEFIKWHSRLCDMQYFKAFKEVNDPNDVIALYYDDAKKESYYVCFRMFDKSDIEKFLIASDGKAIPISIKKDRAYWVMTSNSNFSILVFRKYDNEKRSFGSISPDYEDRMAFEYISSLI